MRADRLFVNGRIYSTPYKRFFEGYFAVRGGYVSALGRGEPEGIEAEEVVDMRGMYAVPGLVDSHTHVESTLMTPRALGRELAKRGVTTIVSEPHEIANVAGMRGVLEMIDAAKGCGIDIYYGIPSSVPSTSEELETTGGVIGVREVRELAENPDMKCLGEVMNARSVADEPDGLARRIVSEFKSAAPDKPVEGHCPRLVGNRLCEFVACGIDSDHTEHTVEEFEQRWLCGMLVQLQDKTLTREIAEYLNSNPELFERTALVTDDVMADELINEGHLDRIVRKAIGLGISSERAIYCATKVPADRMRLFDRGELRPGRLADFFLAESLDDLRAVRTFKAGKELTGGDTSDYTGGFSKLTLDSVHVGEITPDMLRVASRSDREARAIGVTSGTTRTEERRLVIKSDGEFLVPDGRQALTVAVLERHGKNGNRALGFVCGDVHKRGAVASTYCHDHHNLTVAGASAEDMALAANTVRESRGGICVVCDGKVLAHAKLPVAGLMSDRDAETAAKSVGEVTEAMRSLGYRHEHPIMSFCTLSLPVSPALKITDVGLVDVAEGKIVGLFPEP